MTTTRDAGLLAELEELELEIRLHISDIAFLNDELRFFKRLFIDFLPEAIDSQHLSQSRRISAGLGNLESHRERLRAKVLHFKGMIDHIIRDENEPVTLGIIAENAILTNEISALFQQDAALKKELYKLVEELLEKHHRSHLLPPA